MRWWWINIADSKPAAVRNISRPSYPERCVSDLIACNQSAKYEFTIQRNRIPIYLPTERETVVAFSEAQAVSHWNWYKSGRFVWKLLRRRSLLLAGGGDLLEASLGLEDPNNKSFFIYLFAYTSLYLNYNPYNCYVLVGDGSSRSYIYWSLFEQSQP